MLSSNKNDQEDQHRRWLSEFERQCRSEFKNIAILEKKLAELLQSRGYLDPVVRGARVSLRDSYEHLLLALDTSTCPSSQLSYASDLEQALWKLFYIGIEEFRTKIRTLSPSPSTHSNRRKGNDKHESLLRVVNSFKGFLDEASGYFHGLIVKLRAKYGLPPAVSHGEGFMCLTRSPDEGSSHCAVLCQRLLVYLGDLARYRELLAVHSANKRDWTIAVNYYKQAAALCPSSGNPHNQLAVLATYIGDVLGAIYHYCRSLAVDAPFLTARENLTLLLEKKRQHICKISTTVEGSGQLPYLIVAAEKEGLNFRGSSCLIYQRENRDRMTEGESNARDIKELWDCFQVHLMEILCAILTKSCLEELGDAVSKSESVLQQLFSHSINEWEKVFPATRSYRAGGSIVRNIPMLEVVVIVIFLIHEAHKLLQHAVTSLGTSSVSILFRFCCFLVSFLVKQAKQSMDVTLNLLLPGAIVFMEWVASQSSVLKDIKTDPAVAKGLLDIKQEAELLKTILLRRQLFPERNTSYTILDTSSKATSQTAIWEDYELLGFCPLHSSHQNLDFFNLCMTGDGEESFYVNRFLGALITFGYCMETERVCLDIHDQDDKMECDPKEDAVSKDSMHHLEETNSVNEEHPSSSLKEWVQSSEKDPIHAILGVDCDNGNILDDDDEDPSRVHLTLEGDGEHSKEDCSVSIEKSANDLPANSERHVSSVVALEDSVVYAADHPPQLVSFLKDKKQLPVNQTRDGLLQNRVEPFEKSQEKSFLTENTKRFDPCGVHLTLEGDGEHSKEDCSVSIEKSSNDLPANSERHLSSVVALKDSVVYAADHPPQMISFSKDKKQLPVDRTRDGLVQNRVEPFEKSQEESFSTENTKRFDTLYHGTSVCDSEATPIHKGSFSLNSEHSSIAVGCPHCGKQFNISDATEECLQIRKAVRRRQEVSFSKNLVSHLVSPCHETNACEDDGETTENVAMITNANKPFDLRYSSSVKGSCSEIFVNVKMHAENLRWLDDYTHMKPLGLPGSCTSLYHDFPILSSTSDNKRKRADTGIYKMIFNSQEMKRYKTKNPFVRTLNE